MGKNGSAKATWQTFCGKVKHGWDHTVEVMTPVGGVLRVVGSYLMRMRKILLSVPVVVLSIWLAQENWKRLPERVGVGLVDPGEFTRLVSKGTAVFGPLAVTAVCLLLMYCSRKTLYPWLISVFSLLLPVLLYITNVLLI